MPYTYILARSDGTHDVGSTWNVLERVHEYNDALGAAYTRNRLPVALVYTEEYPSISEAFAQEKQVEGWCRGKRRALIDGRPQDLLGIVRLHKERVIETAQDETGLRPP
jgi:putative endonuclease